MSRPYVVNFHEHPSADVPDRCRDLGIDVAVLLPVGPDAAALARDMAAAAPDRYVAFHWVNTAAEPDHEARRLRRVAMQAGVRGVKFQPMDQHLYPNDRRFYPVFEVCEELGLVVTFHMGTVYLGPYMHEMGVPMLAKYCDPISLNKVAFDFPDLKLCLAHLGGAEQVAEPRLQAGRPVVVSVGPRPAVVGGRDRGEHLGASPRVVVAGEERERAVSGAVKRCLCRAPLVGLPVVHVATFCLSDS